MSEKNSPTSDKLSNKILTLHVAHSALILQILPELDTVNDQIKHMH